MASIDRDKLVGSVLFYLGDANVLPDEIILATCESVILEVGDDDEFYPEILCKSIKACAIQNKVLSTTDNRRGIKREKSHNREVEWYKTNPTEYWKEFINSLPELCAAFGYCGLPSVYKGMFISNVAVPVRYPAGSPQVGTVESTANCDGEPYQQPCDDDC